MIEREDETDPMTENTLPPEPTDSRLSGETKIEPGKLEVMFTQLENGVIVIGRDGRVNLANHAACAILELEETGLTGRPIREVCQHPDMLDICDPLKSHPTHSEINLDDGRVFLVQTSLIPQVGLVIVLQNISYLKELDRIKTDFVYTVSHDLRSPLTAILGYVELVSRVGPVNEQQQEFIQRVQYSVNSITALINDLLDMGRIEAGFDAGKEIVHLLPIIQEVLDSMRNRIKDKKHTVKVEVPSNLPAILGNPIRLRQMITNLINNAVKYTPSGGLITILGQAEDGQIILQVSDNGQGILPADQPHVFDKFYRGSNVSYDAPGSGLGLAIVQTIVQNHQGRVWLDSTPGQGTTFTVVLPV
ncbi:MAG TPA: ATP-binding protein [Anaerolineales bacterium]|nr:ATP-binding protein [Anaerolineales bacterium]